MDKLDFLKVQKKVLTSQNLDELKEAVKEVNEFIKNNKIKSNSDEFKSLEEKIRIIHLKLKKSRKFTKESKSYVVSEEQLIKLSKMISEIDSTSQDIIDRILDQISQHGQESLTPSQHKKLKDFSSGKSLEYDKPKYRDRIGVTFESEDEPTIVFVLRETVETEEGYEYLGDVEFMDNVYVGFITSDNEDNLTSIEFENLETQKDLLEDSKDNQHLINFFRGVVKGLSDEDNPY